MKYQGEMNKHDDSACGFGVLMPQDEKDSDIKFIAGYWKDGKQHGLGECL